MWKRYLATSGRGGVRWTTVGYIIWPAGARLRISRLPVEGPVGNYMAQRCAEGDLNAYGVLPMTIRQGAEWNVNSDVGHSDAAHAEVAVVASIPRAVSKDLLSRNLRL